MKKEILLLLICFVLIALVLNIYLKQNEVFVIKNAERVRVSFSIDPSEKVCEFAGEDVEKIVSLIKPETWKKGKLTLELAPVEHINFYKDNKSVIIGILDADEVLMFKVYSATNGKWNNDSCYYKTTEVKYLQLIESLNEMLDKNEI